MPRSSSYETCIHCILKPCLGLQIKEVKSKVSNEICRRGFSSKKKGDSLATQSRCRSGVVNSVRQKTPLDSRIYMSLLLLSEKGLCSRRETVLPRFEGASSTMGVMGVRRPSEVS